MKHASKTKTKNYRQKYKIWSLNLAMKVETKIKQKTNNWRNPKSLREEAKNEGKIKLIKHRSKRIERKPNKKLKNWNKE